MYFGVIFIVLGAFGFITVLILSVLKLILWWQGVLIIIGLIIFILIGFFCFKQGRYFKHTIRTIKK